MKSNAIQEDSLIMRLASLLGEKKIILGSALEKYSHDETEDFFFPPLCAVLPETKEEVLAVVRLAKEAKVPLVPRGGGTGLAGGVLPVRGGVVVSLEKMNKVLDLDEKNALVVVEPGVITQVLQEKVEQAGWYYPPDPSSRGSCFIGGNVATNASGPVCLKYGSTKNYCLSLEVVTGEGQFFQAGGRIRKSSSGLDLLSFFVGSEGILGIFTEITLKIVHPPFEKLTFFFSFESLEKGFSFMEALLKAVPEVAVCEFMEREAMEIAEERSNIFFPEKGAGAFLVELHLGEGASSEAPVEKLYELSERFQAKAAILAQGEKREKLWSLRRITGEAVKKKAPYKEDDCVVPRAHLPHLLEEIKKIEQETKLQAVCYGHAGDGNLHVNILKEGVEEEEWERKKAELEEKLFAVCAQLGGTISGEHGIGWVQRKYLCRFFSEKQLKLMKQVKQFFDPEGIMNPDKVLF